MPRAELRSQVNSGQIDMGVRGYMIRQGRGHDVGLLRDASTLGLDCYVYAFDFGAGCRTAGLFQSLDLGDIVELLLQGGVHVAIEGGLVVVAVGGGTRRGVLGWGRVVVVAGLVAVAVGWGTVKHEK